MITFKVGRSLVWPVGYLQTLEFCFFFFSFYFFFCQPRILEALLILFQSGVKNKADCTFARGGLASNVPA